MNVPSPDNLADLVGCLTHFRLRPKAEVRDRLGGVNEFEPVSSGGDMDYSEEAVGELIIAGCD
jgi:hypothetical protein